MKRITYILGFALLGVMVAALIHAAIEVPLLWLISSDFETYSSSYWWQNWSVLHRYISLGLWIVGLLAGTRAGFHYWKVIYVEEKYGTPRL